MHDRKLSVEARAVIEAVDLKNDDDQLITKRERYEASLADDLSVKDMIGANGWNWPKEWIGANDFLCLIIFKLLCLSEGKHDKAAWITND
ncbi:hypothetical protein Tco_0964203 [Tanacetum coccineum]